MQIGLIVYSHTGHTLLVARRLMTKLTTDGHTVSLLELETVFPLPMNATTTKLKAIPSIDAFDAIILGTPVRGGLPSPPMKVFLDNLPSLKNKKVVLFATGFFPAGWGRNQTLDQMKAVCEGKGADIRGTVSVGWWSLSRRKHITHVVDIVSHLYSPDDRKES